MASVELRWWQSGVIYQIYPCSSKDTDADGVGNLNGITSEVDYLRWLGVDAVWLSPIFTSPMVDLGYDVANYTGVDPVFGTIQDFDALVAACHHARIKVVLDFVPNHSSRQHPWFKDSTTSRDAEKRNWYVWRDPRPLPGPATGQLRRCRQDRRVRIASSCMNTQRSPRIEGFRASRC